MGDDCDKNLHYDIWSDWQQYIEVYAWVSDSYEMRWDEMN